jgi:hypothetical protein
MTALQIVLSSYRDAAICAITDDLANIRPNAINGLIGRQIVQTAELSKALPARRYKEGAEFWKG